jgi:hypothetical protein
MKEPHIPCKEELAEMRKFNMILGISALVGLLLVAGIATAVIHNQEAQAAIIKEMTLDYRIAKTVAATNPMCRDPTAAVQAQYGAGFFRE